MFIGRKKELLELKEQFSSSKKTAVLVYGKRRVGKSTLIKEAAKDFEGIVINHLCVKTNFKGNLQLLSRSITLALGFPQIEFSTIFDIFDFLKKQGKKILLILDEYQYLKESLRDMEVDSYMQSILDSVDSNVKIVLCGSYIAIMKELLKEENPLFGRFSKVINLEEFDYYEASAFYQNLSVREKIRFYSVFGGSPYVLSNLDYNKTLEENVVELLVNQDSILRTYIENVILKEIQKSFDIRILEIIGNEKKRYTEILNLLGSSDNGLLDKQLKSLLSMQTIKKVYPINRKNDKKKLFYEIKDNLVRFYFTYIFANDSLITKFGENQFFENTVAPSLNTFVSFRFEDIVVQYFIRLAHNGKLKDVEDFGSYWYDDKKNGKNGQFDCVLKEKDGYDFFEVKFYQQKMTKNECKKEENQIRSVIDMNCRKVGFVCSAGFDFFTDEYTLIDGEKLFDALAIGEN